MANIPVILALVTSLATSTGSQVVDEGIGKARQLIYQGDGWSVFRARNGKFYSCFAYKLAQNESEADFSPTGSGMALGMIGGRKRGFKLYIGDSEEKLEYGFFGKELYLGTTALEVDGQIFTAIYSFGDLKLPQLLQLDGKRAEIEINSYEYRSHIGDMDRYSGHFDFTGLKSAHAAVNQCHATKAVL